MSYMPLDHETADLILQLQLVDLKYLDERSKGKGREDELPDAVKARRLYEEELRCTEQFFSDQRMVRSIATAVQTDWEALASHQVQERRAVEDRLVARRLGGEDVQEENTKPSTYTDYDNEFIEMLRCLYVGPPNKNSLKRSYSIPEGSGEVIPAKKARKAAGEETDEGCGIACAICMDNVLLSMIVALSCGHVLCKECIRVLFQRSVMDRDSFPPTCCQPITLDTARPFLSRHLIASFEREYKV